MTTRKCSLVGQLVKLRAGCQPAPGGHNCPQWMCGRDRYFAVFAVNSRALALSASAPALSPAAARAAPRFRYALV